MYLSEHNIYGSSRLGQEQLNKEMEGNSYTYTGLLANEVGDKRCELSNHLGNVLEVVTDRKLPSSTYYYGYNFNTGLDGWAACTQAIVSQADGQLQISSYGASNCTYILQTTVVGESYTVMIRSNRGTAPGLRLALFGIGTTNLIDGENTWITFTATSTTTGLIIEPTSTAASYVYYVDAVEIYQNSRYVADVVSYSDYYPYGMQMPGRHESSGDYRYGFNGEESVDEISGEGNTYDYGNRMYNPRIGKFLSLDAYAAKYPSISPYTYAINSPIMAKDVGGDSVLFYSESGVYLGYSNDNQRYKGKNLLVIIDDKMVDAFTTEYNRKRGAEYTKDLTPTQIEAHVAGLEAMGISIDVTDFVAFFNEYRYKKMGDDGKIESVPIEAAARNYEELFEWTADIYNKAVNSLDKNGSVAVNEGTASTDNISDHVVTGGSSVWGFDDFHTHSSENLNPDPSKDDKNAADMHGNSNWHIVVGEGMFTLFRDENPKVSQYGENKQIKSITIYTTGSYTEKRNRQNQ